MRPMFYDYPEDKECYHLGEQYMFGDDILFAPIVNRGQTEKEVYLPKGNWIFTRDESIFEGNRKYSMSAEINEYVAFVKVGSAVIDAFRG